MTDEEKAQELTIKNVTDGKNKYFSWGFYKGCVVGLEYNNKQIAELEEKISVLLSCKNCSENKGGWVCAKEYENKCLAQKIEFIKELEKEKCELLGIIQGKDKVIQELEKELKIFQRNWQNQKNISFAANCSLHKAKDIVKKFSEFVNNEVEFDPEHPQEYTDLWNELCEKAEQFLNSEVKEQGLFPFDKWHKVADGDLPKDGRIVSDQEGNNVRYVKHHNKWYYRHRSCEADVIAWCELPKYMEK